MITVTGIMLFCIFNCILMGAGPIPYLITIGLWGLCMWALSAKWL